MRIDLERRGKDEYTPKCYDLDERQLRAFSAYIRGLSDEGKVKQLTDRLANALQKKYDAISYKAIKTYVESVLRNVETYTLQGLADNYLNTQSSFERKINALAKAYQKGRFNFLLTTGKIFCKPSFRLPNRITPKDKIVGVPKSLYMEENGADGFETRVFNQIANLGNVLFWHRNLERGKGFCINGFINHYPDFLVMLKSGHILMIETKGDQLDGSDSESKIALGTTWANKAGAQYRYFMVFDNKKVDGAYTLPELAQIIETM